MNSRNNAHQRNDGQQKNSPQLQLQHVLVVGSLNSTGDSSQEENKDSVSAPTVVLPDSLGIVNASVKARGSPHGEADTILEKKDDGSDDTEITVNRVEVNTVAFDLVILDDSHTSYKNQESHEVEDGVNALADTLLFGGMSRL